MTINRQMLKRATGFAAGVAILAVSCGCCSRYALAPEHLAGLPATEGGGRVLEHYFIQNYGWYLFESLPIVCGDTDEDAVLPLAFFSDQVRSDLLTRIFDEHVREKGARAASVTTFRSDHVAMEIPLVSFSIVLPYILCYREVQISGLLVEGEAADGKEAK